ncbi:MAG: hypothetical protein NVSMB64_20020 [Candidatus Velthaea sp.]
MEDEIVITLTRDDVQLLNLILGYATGGALADRFPARPGAVLRLANKINENTPGWRPYAEMPEHADAPFDARPPTNYPD